MMSSVRPTVRYGFCSTVRDYHNAGFRSTWNETLQRPLEVRVSLGGKKAEAI